MNEVIQKIKTFLARRRNAYQATFNLDDHANQRVLKDLARFCRAGQSCFNQDPRLHAMLEGRREVWLRITDHLNLDPEEFWKKYGRNEE